MAAINVVLIIWVAAALYYDATRRIIPNRLCICGAITGTLFHTAQDGLSGAGFAAAGLAVGLASYMVLYFLGAVGAGDVKMFASAGTFLGTENVLYAGLYSILYAGLIAIFILMYRACLPQKLKYVYTCLVSAIVLDDWRFLRGTDNGAHIEFPFMYAAAPGIVTACFYIYG